MGITNKSILVACIASIFLLSSCGKKEPAENKNQSQESTSSVTQAEQKPVITESASDFSLRYVKEISKGNINKIVAEMMYIPQNSSVFMSNINTKLNNINRSMSGLNVKELVVSQITDVGGNVSVEQSEAKINDIIRVRVLLILGDLVHTAGNAKTGFVAEIHSQPRVDDPHVDVYLILTSNGWKVIDGQDSETMKELKEYIEKSTLKPKFSKSYRPNMDGIYYKKGRSPFM